MLRWKTSHCGIGTGGRYRHGIGGWHGLVARLSICPLENFPVFLENTVAPVEKIAITISDGREEECHEQHPSLEYSQTYDWNIF